MVYYCCVKGCKNKRIKKEPNSVISFHKFPVNKELRSKWLKAIGRPNWVVPRHARICSAHFNYNQMDYGCRTRIMENEVPVEELPPYSNFDASDVQVCRICLATDIRMYNLHGTLLGTYMNSILESGENQYNTIDGLPQYVCYQCAASLIKCHKLVEQTMIAQATLLDIFTQHGQITKLLVKQTADRMKLKLISSINYCKSTNYIDMHYDDNCNKSVIHLDKNEPDNGAFFKTEKELYYEYTEPSDTMLKIDVNEHKIELLKDDHKNNVGSIEYTNIPVNEPTEYNQISDVNSDNDIDTEENVNLNMLKSKNEKLSKGKRKVEMRRAIRLTPNEKDIKQYFDIVTLTEQEQIEEWEKTGPRRLLTSETIYHCEICSKKFAHAVTYHSHLRNHEPSQGQYECPICKLRFKTDSLAKSHSNRAHTKKFYCKTCPKAFNNVGMAKKHRLWHAGHIYKCKSCSFTTAHESSLGVHMRRQHSHMHSCADCGREFVSARGMGLHRAAAHKNLVTTNHSDVSFRCEQCDVNFTSEGAKRVHILTSYQHRKKPDLCDTSKPDPILQDTCKKCGLKCSSLSELIIHSKTEHPRKSRKTTWRMPTDCYPTQCQLCGETVNCRKTHWSHVRQKHPKERDTYQKVVTAVCDTCGKGFQNSTKLQLHLLRHDRPRVRCNECPRLFYDKFGLARHAATHSADAPHTCRICGRGFKRQCGLDRHARVHTGATPYECTICNKKFKHSSSVKLHVRTVHYKMPRPRRKRTRPVRNAPVDDTNV